MAGEIVILDLWIMILEQYQELFAICQALPGPGSTKMTFCIALMHAGFLPAVFVFLMWRLVSH
jgi:chromate transport protein ChrA